MARSRISCIKNAACYSVTHATGACLVVACSITERIKACLCTGCTVKQVIGTCCLLAVAILYIWYSLSSRRHSEVCVPCCQCSSLSRSYTVGGHEQSQCKNRWVQSATIGLGAGLGNHMFDYASLLGIATLTGSKLHLDEKNWLWDVFELEGERKPLFLENQYGRNELSAVYDDTLCRMPGCFNISIRGYFLSYEYFKHIEGRIRNNFRFKDNIRSRVLQRNPELRLRERPFIGVHVRRTDHLRALKLENLPIPDERYLSKAMEYFKKKYPNALFVVVSDDIEWSKERIKGNNVIYGNGSPEEDLATLAMCDHTIITVGTFGWWGAWLAGGEVVKFDKYAWHKHYYPNKWITMTN